MSSIADTMLAMSSPERNTKIGFKRPRDVSQGSSIAFGGKALKRSHTLSSVGETTHSINSRPNITTNGINVGDDAKVSSSRGTQLRGKALRRTVSEGKPLPSHPPRYIVTKCDMTFLDL